MESLQWQLLEKYGNRARIIKAERIQVGGLFGLGADTSFEVTVEVDGQPAPVPALLPDAGAGKVISGKVVGAKTGRSAKAWKGMSALLAQADSHDGPAKDLTLSTQKPDFDAILDRMSERVTLPAPEDDAVDAQPAPTRGSGRGGRGRGRGGNAGAVSADPVAGLVADLAGPPVEETPDLAADLLRPPAGEVAVPESSVPSPSTRAGDLIVLVGLRDQPLAVARTMMRELKRGAGAELRTAGDHRVEDVPHVIVDSGEVKKAQALAAVANRPLLVAFSLGGRTSSSPSVLSSVRPDQLWLVADAAHKADDTAAWVRQIAWFTAPDAVAVVGSRDTATPETINDLGYPIGWVDGQQAFATEF